MKRGTIALRTLWGNDQMTRATILAGTALLVFAAAVQAQAQTTPAPVAAADTDSTEIIVIVLGPVSGIGGRCDARCLRR